MDLVSIIIPVFNTGEPFRACMESVLNQTYPNLEVVLVDDLSTDPVTLNLLQEFSQNDNRVKLILGAENHGPSYCRNRGVENASGKYFMFLDSDDRLVPDCVDRMHKAIVGNQTDFVVCNVKNFSEDEIAQSDNYFVFKLPETGVVKTDEFIQNGGLTTMPISVYGKLFNLKKYCSKDLSFCEEMRMGEDHDWSYRLFCGMTSFTVLNFFAVKRLLRQGSITHSATEMELMHDFHSQYLTAEVLKQYGYFEQLKDEFFIDCCTRLLHVLKLANTAETRHNLVQYAGSEFQKMGYSINLSPTYLNCFICMVKYRLCKVFKLKRSKQINKALYKTYSQILKG